MGADDFDAQCVRVFKNIEAALKSAAAPAGRTWCSSPPTWCTRRTSRSSWRCRKREFPRLFPDGKYPPNTLLIIDRLVGEPFLVEVQPIAAL